MSSSAGLQKRLSWQELDILRGIAALLMIINHAGYKILQEDLLQQGLSKNLIFLGSFAPVLFFFITGVGFGIQSDNSKKNDWSIFYKVVILILADQFLFWKRGQWLGLDFLGFIGLSSGIMAILRYSKSSIFYSILGFSIFSGLRYVVGPFVHHLGYAQGFWAFLLGTSSIDGISYPLSPWLAYPFLGYLLGIGIVKFLVIINRNSWLIMGTLLLTSTIPMVGGIILQKLGASFHRWGTVGIGFYVISFTVIIWGLLATLIIAKSKQLESPLLAGFSLRGISSLAVVPIHYFLIYLLTLFNCVNLNFLWFAITVIGLVFISFYLAHLIDFLSLKVSKIFHLRSVRLSLLSTLSLAIVLSVPYNFRGEQDLGLNFFIFLGQIILCLLLKVKW